jgi:hypothetical protein
MKVLMKSLQEKSDLDVAMVEQKALPEDMSGFKSVILFVHGRLEAGTERAVIDYTNTGGRLICLHHSISSGKAGNEFYFDFLGVRLDKGGIDDGGYKWLHSRWSLVNLNRRHYITNHEVDWPDTAAYAGSDVLTVETRRPIIKLKDDSEVFINHKFTDGREKTVLCGLIYTDETTGKTYMQDRGAWLKRRGKGTIFYFMPGHSVSDYENADVSRIILNAIQWSGR